MSEMYPQLQAFGKAELIHSVFFQGAPTPSPWLQVQLPGELVSSKRMYSDSTKTSSSEAVFPWGKPFVEVDPWKMGRSWPQAEAWRRISLHIRRKITEISEAQLLGSERSKPLVGLWVCSTARLKECSRLVWCNENEHAQWLQVHQE